MDADTVEQVRELSRDQVLDAALRLMRDWEAPGWTPEADGGGPGGGTFDPQKLPAVKRDFYYAVKGYARWQADHPAPAQEPEAMAPGAPAGP